MKDDDVHGVVLYLQNMSKTKNSEGKYFISATVRGETSSATDVGALENKLNDGVKVYLVNDFKTAIAESLRIENIKLEKKAAELERAYKALQEETKKMREALSVLHVDLGFFASDR